MKVSQIAVQLFTLRDFCQDAEALRATLKKVREIGYGAVEVGGIGEIAPAEVAAICAEVGVTICATHESSDLIRREPERVVERLRDYGVTTTVYPYPAGVDFAEPASVQALLEDLRRAGEVFQRAGCKLCYHNHAIEFIRYGEGTLLEAIRDSIPAEDLHFELDTYWVQYGGGDPVRWCESVPGRLPLIHLKDYQFTPENKPIFGEVGSGNLDFGRIVAAAEESGCEWFVVEQDFCPGDPFVSIKQSLTYLRDHIVR